MNYDAALNTFHPIIKEWFIQHIGTPSLPQVLGWHEIMLGKNVLISAPTGSGKTLAAFLESIDYLLKKGLEDSLPEGVCILYVSPLKALNNDIYKNLDIPLEGIKKCCMDAGLSFPNISKAVRTGDTPQNERQKILKRPPHILITTPESLYLMLTSKKSAVFLKNVRYLIVDEIHTMLGTKRGVHLGVSIERLEHMTQHELVRIGLSATISPIETAARYLGGLRQTETGCNERPVSIVEPLMKRNKDLKIYMPVSDYRALEQGTIWPEIYDSILKLIRQHTSTIIFVNNRAVAEKVAANVNSMVEEEICRPHHGSLSKNKRLEVEDRFKNGDLKCIIATSTLELGIDIGSVDLMVQVASPISVSSGLQRLGRAGHRLDATSIGRIIPKTRGDLIKSAFISKEMLEGNIEKEQVPMNCLDILAQHIVSMSCEAKWSEKDMLAVIRGAWSYRNLKERDFIKVLAMLSGDFEHLDDIPSKPRIFWDRQNKTIEGTGYSRMLAVNSSGTIPDRGYFSVFLEDYKTRIGELDEVFVFEARLGDRFMLGNSAWKVVKIEKNRVIVAPGSSVGAKTPFWQGDGIGSPFEQGIAFGRFLKELSDKLVSEDFINLLTSSDSLDETAALNIKNYLMDQQEAVGCLSHDRRIVVEYFKDMEADQKIIIHAHFGGKVNSVLAILLQKALEDSIRCQAFSSHSNDAILIHVYGCPDDLSNVLSLLKFINVESTLLTMLPNTSRFAMTFRYNAYRSLMMGIRNLGQRLPLWLQRLRSVDALENARKHLDHPLLVETMRECLEEIFDIPNTINVLKNIQNGDIEVVEKQTMFPSPFASELLFEFKGMMMYAEKEAHPRKDNSPLVSGIDALNLSYHRAETAAPINPEAVLEVSRKNSSLSKLQDIASSNQLHSFLLIYGDISRDELSTDKIRDWLDRLVDDKKALCLDGANTCPSLYIAIEELELYACATGMHIKPQETGTDAGFETWTQDEAVSRIIKRYIRYHSPFILDDVIKRYGFDRKKTDQYLLKQKSEGLIVSGHFTNEYTDQFCHFKIFEAIIRKDSSLRSNEVVARNSDAYASFLHSWQKVGAETVSPEASLNEVIRQMEGLFLPADWWENIVFPARVKGYSSSQLNRLCASGNVFWRIDPDNANKTLMLGWFCIENLSLGIDCLPESKIPLELDQREERVFQILKLKGACFTHILTALTGIHTSELLEILEQLVYKGLIVNDSFSSIRYFINQNDLNKKLSERNAVQHARRIALSLSRMDMGRWEIAWPIIENDLQKLIDRWFIRYGLLSKDTLSMEKTPFSWNEVYEALKLREYAGTVLRGYFIQGISGIQYMIPEAYKKLGSPTSIQVLNACDPAQAYGKILSRKEDRIAFTNIPGTVIVSKEGNPIVIFERYGEKVQFSGNESEVTEAISAFKQAFVGKRIWPDRKKIVVKYWPDNAGDKDLLQKALSAAGFKNEILKMVIWR